MSTEVKTISARAITKLKMEETQPRLTRSSSLDKIKKFNTFICSQQYYVLPALLNWLKSSQTNLQASTESTIYFLRAFIFNAFFKFYLLFFRKQQFSVEQIKIVAKKVIAVVISNFFETFSKCFEPTFLLMAGVYFGCFIVCMQLLFTIYLMYLLFLPLGFLFLMGCMMSIQYLCYKTMIPARPLSGKGKKLK
ncbi:uncharacterized protein LOC126881110 [Diabrotica virgifera virgifera]|uniref:Uncharacterized protein LOC114342590 n=1 Tax=Diabrotica virgifera virgifera TaxID=50390 RepID=A0A6P7GT36_DIAVI|nr:uncharacterized protein LOC126881110 [Diabrotica virgifera virgifera]XP_050501113.1 uncharacterized protein LOC126881110 [Diabrotica virgifera virgifera]